MTIDFTLFARLPVPRTNITSKALLTHYLIGLGCIEGGNLGARGNLDEIVGIVGPEILTHSRLSGHKWVVEGEDAGGGGPSPVSQSHDADI
jgi:hypothetical protein